MLFFVIFNLEICFVYFESEDFKVFIRFDMEMGEWFVISYAERRESFIKVYVKLVDVDV